MENVGGCPSRWKPRNVERAHLCLGSGDSLGGFALISRQGPHRETFYGLADALCPVPAHWQPIRGTGRPEALITAGLWGGHRTAVGGQPHPHRAPAVTLVTALSSRRLAGFLPGDLFAWLGADIPGGGHIPFIAAYLGCQAGLGGGLRLRRAPVAPRSCLPVRGSWRPLQRPPGSACCVRTHSPAEAGPTGWWSVAWGRRPGSKGMGEGLIPMGAPDAPRGRWCGPQELCRCFSRPCRFLPEPPAPGSPLAGSAARL